MVLVRPLLLQNCRGASLGLPATSNPLQISELLCMCIHSWVVISLSNTSPWPNRTVGSCELVVVRWALWVGCCGSVGVGWSLCWLVSEGQSLWVSCCGSVAVGRLLWIGRCGYGSFAVCWSLLWGTCFGSIVTSIVTLCRTLWVCRCVGRLLYFGRCSIRSLRFGCDRSVPNLSLWDDSWKT